MASVSAANHPLDPLSADEITSAVEIILSERRLSTNAFFPTVALREPEKEKVLPWTPGSAAPDREAFVVAYELSPYRTYEGIVDLNERRVKEWRWLRGVEAPETMAEYFQSSLLLQTNELWIAALKRRGITDPARVEAGAIPPGVIPVAGEHHGNRILVAMPYLRSTNRMTWEPVEGLLAVVDMTEGKVKKVIDRGVYPLETGVTDVFDPAIRGDHPPLKPLVVTQPEGPSFTVDDHAVSWDRWRFRYSLHPREGLVLHQVSWEEEPGRQRPILYRASISDLLVAYGDTDEGWSWRAYYDAVDFGLGHFAQPLRPGLTTVSYATLLSEPLPDGTGGARIATNVVDIYERDAGILWSHTEPEAGTVGPRARELVIGFLTTIGNYDYRCQWSFRQDGSMEFHVYLTGLMQLKGTHASSCAACAALSTKPGTVTPAGEQAHGVIVARHLIAPHHQHFFNLRLDFDVDGTANAVKELNLSTDRTGRGNRYGNGFSLTETVFAKEREAVRNINPATARLWAVFNPGSVSPLGHPAGYAVEPGMTGSVLLSKDSPVRKRAGYIDHHFFATRYRPTERYAAGDYPVRTGKPENVLTWTKNNESIFNEDVVVWSTLIVTHVARPEEFPVMPVAHANLRLTPMGFFRKNPALGVPDTPAQTAQD